MSRRSALLVPALLLSLATPAAAQRLSNGVVTARFGPRGITSIEVPAIDARYVLARDGFGITIDNTAYDSAVLAPPTVVREPSRVAYFWNAGPHRVAVVYELQPGWLFVSKHVSIVNAPAPEYRVNEVVLFRSAMRDPIVDSYVHQSARQDLGPRSYAIALRFDRNRSLIATAQNPFLAIARQGSEFTLGYAPDMSWTKSRGPFVSDRGLLAVAAFAGEREPARMLPEWQMGPPPAEPGFYRAEIASLTSAVRNLMVYRPETPANVFVGWCVNDYQIDIATEAGRAEYKRVIDRAAELGAGHVLFAPTNSDLAKRDDSTDDWRWENLLWLGLGQKIRRNEWKPGTDPVPASVQEMLDYAKSKRVTLLAYVYPVLAFSQNREWLTTRRGATPDAKKYASLASPALQDWLIETLVAFQKQTGIGGYSFDHTFLNFDGASAYAQWWGWRRVMETLRQRVPGIAIDGRQAYHLYGPWGWLAGTYPHPTYSDEQPESFRPFPDLSFDRVSANRERYTAYFYRNHEFAPGELVPGFITHQTSRSDDSGEMPQRKTDRGIMLTPFRVRDWDYLGWRYSLLSSIAVGGWNNVINMIPARDPEEYRHFSDADKDWFRRWIEFARANRELLRRTRTILGQPALGKVDGTAAIEFNHGYIFLFNPNARRMEARIPLDEAIGLDEKGAYHLEELYPRQGRRIGKPQVGFWSHGDTLSLELDGHSATVLEIQPAPLVFEPLLFNVPGKIAVVGDKLVVTDVSGEPGTAESMLIVRRDKRRLAGLRVNGRDFAVTPAGPDTSALQVSLTFAGEPFRRAQQVGMYDPRFAGGRFTARFRVPRRIFDQLAARRQTWPIPWTDEDLKTTWLAPERLLLYVQIAEPDDKMTATLSIDGRGIELRKAYSAVRAVDRTFVGFYTDISSIEADRDHELTLELPALKPGQFQGVFFENVEPEYTNEFR